MRVTELIAKKKKGQPLTQTEIDWLVRGYVDGQIPDYQVAALLMAIWFQGMNAEETTQLTLAMAASGEQVDLSSIPGIKVDKHSTGGVGDTTTLLIAPLVAACGGKVAKMSGRGLGHTGGTIDKLEAIPGFSAEQDMAAFIRIVTEQGLAVIGQSEKIVPADRKLYALRDVTETVDNSALIASSIMSKKLASGCDALVLDVKTGRGAFMKEREQARELARRMVTIGKSCGRETVAYLTDMNQPLGQAVGNALEVREAIEILRGEGGGALLELSLNLAAEMLCLAQLAPDTVQARTQVENALASGKALERLAAMITAQGGDACVTEDTSLLPQARTIFPVKAECAGLITTLDAWLTGEAARLLGAGRQKKGDVIDPAVGLWLKKRAGEQVEKGEELAVLYINDEQNLPEVLQLFKEAVTIKTGQGESAESVKPPLIYERLT